MMVKLGQTNISIRQKQDKRRCEKIGTYIPSKMQIFSGFFRSSMVKTSCELISNRQIAFFMNNHNFKGFQQQGPRFGPF
jgi:hypothetical protein